MKSRSSILINKLILVGHRKNYVIPFYRGVNIIYGDSATGKSSILELINYLLGSSKFVYDQEIEASVAYAAMELELNDQVYVIKRDIFDPNKLVEISPVSFDQIDQIYPKKVAPNFKGEEGPDGYLSDFLLGALNLPIIKIKEAPSKVDSATVRLSFRDVFKFCYLKQDDVGSKQLLDLGNWVLHTKNKQTFKYIFNLLDTNIAELEVQISKLSSEQKQMESKYKSVSDFLRETQFESAVGLSDSYDELNQQAQIIEGQLATLSESMVADNETYNYLRETLNDCSAKIRLSVDDRYSSEQAIERFVRLKNDYQSDVQKLKAVRVSQKEIGKLPAEIFNCPICDNSLPLEDFKEEHNLGVEDKINHEVNVLNRRMKDLDYLLETERAKHHSISVEIRSLTEDQFRLRRLLDEESAQMISPYLSERDGLTNELATIKEKLNQLSNSQKIRNQQKAIFDEIDRLIQRIAGLEDRLDKLKASAPSIEQVLADLGDLLSKYLAKVNIKDRRDISIDRSSFLPILRNREYKDITSGGLRTILSIGYLLGIFEHGIGEDLSLPPFLMIDTVGKYLGKTQEQYSETDGSADINENISDPSKYQNMYEYMIDVAEKAEEKDRVCQIILVDNDVPSSIQEKYAGFVVAHFSHGGRGGLPVGLIDDAG